MKRDFAIHLATLLISAGFLYAGRAFFYASKGLETSSSSMIPEYLIAGNVVESRPPLPSSPHLKATRAKKPQEKNLVDDAVVPTEQIPPSVDNSDSEVTPSPRVEQDLQSAPRPQEPAPDEVDRVYSAPSAPFDETVAPSKPVHATNTNFPISRLGVDFGLDYFKIDAKDPVNGGRATFLSDANPEMRVAWDLDWAAEWSSRLRFTYVSEKINNDTLTASTISGKSSSVYEFEIGAVRRWSEKNRTTISLGSTSRIFTRSTTATDVWIDRVQSLEVKLGQEIDLVKMNSATAGVSLDAVFINGGTGSGYTTKSGYGFGSSGFIKHGLKSGIELKGEVFYEQSWQNSTLVNQAEQHVGALFGISKGFD